MINKIKDKCPNTKDWSNTSTRIINDLIELVNKLVDKINEYE